MPRPRKGDGHGRSGAWAAGGLDAGLRWSGNEPEALNDVDMAEEFGAVWEGDELVHYQWDSLVWQVEHYEKDEYMADND